MRGVIVVAVVAALAVACGDDGEASSGAGAGGSGAGASDPAGAGGSGAGATGVGGGETEPVGEVLVALMNLEDEIFEVDVDGSPFSFLAMNPGGGVVFAAPLFDCGVGLGTCVEVFREGFDEPTELAVDDGETVVHVFARDAGEEGDFTASGPFPEPGPTESSVVAYDDVATAELSLLLPAGTLEPLGTGLFTVAGDAEVVLVQPGGAIVQSGIFLEAGGTFGLAADASSTGGVEVVVCPLLDGEDCASWAYSD